MSRSKKPLVLIALLAAAGGGVAYYVHATRAPRDTNVLRIWGNIEVISAGLSFKIPGRVMSRPVDEGQMVRVGQLVAVLDSNDLADHVAVRDGELGAAKAALAELLAGSRPEEIAEAAAAVKRAQAFLDELLAGSRREEIEAAEATATSAKVDSEYLATDLKRVLAMHETGEATVFERDRAMSSSQMAKARLGQAEAQLRLVKAGPREEDIRQARHALEQVQQKHALAVAGPRKETIDQARARVRQGVLPPPPPSARDRADRTNLTTGPSSCQQSSFSPGLAVSADLAAGRTARVQIVLDGSDSNTAGIAASYAARIVETLSRQMLLERVARSRGAIRAPPELDLEVRAWFNENLESRNYFVPGVIALIVMLATLLLTSMAVVREKEIGTMEQILVAPITPAEFILGKTVPFALIGLGDVVLITAVGVLWFGVPLRGSLVLLGGASGLYLLTALGVGLLISTISQTQQQAMMSTFFFFFPAILLSGFMFPIANMPPVIQVLTYANPLRYFLVIIRGVFLKGVGVEVLWPQLAALAVLGVATLTLAVTRFHKTLK